MVGKSFLHDLKSGMVLDRSVFVDMSALNMSSCIAGIRAAKDKPLIVVDNADTFFTPAHLVTMIQENNPNFIVVNEGLGNFFTQAQIDALTGFNQGAIALGEHEEQANEGEVIVNLAQYKFDPVPHGWSINTHMSLGPNKIKRKVKNKEGDGTMFFMHPTDFEKLWLFASKAWSDGGAPLAAKFNTGLGVKLATVFNSHIVIGGNYIRRYEIEQVAKHRGWSMTYAQAIAA